MGDHQSPFEGTPPAAGRLAGTGGPDGLGGFGRSFLTDSVGRNGANRPEDVQTASSFLAANGLMPAPTREATEAFHRGFEAGQSKLNDLSGGGLQVDGLARPWGPTEMLSQRAVTSGQMAAPAPRADRNSRGARPVLPPPHTTIPAIGAGNGTRPTLPPPHRTIDGRPEPARRDPAKPNADTLPADNDNLLRRLVEIATGKRVEFSLPDPNGKDSRPVNRDALLDVLQTLIDNGILLGGQFMRVGTPTVVTPTLEKPWEHLIREKDRGA